jgi:hypothetical protein
MALVLRTPGVYTEEISLFPPAVAQVETAVPAFIGYTERAAERGRTLRNIPTRIRSLADYEELYGGAADVLVNGVELDIDNNVSTASVANSYLLYDSLRMFFANGGSKCYIISVGSYTDAVAEATLAAGLTALAREDEPTLIVMPDSVLLQSNAHYNLQVQALAQCFDLKDRFAILDLLQRNNNADLDIDDAVAEFRSRIGVNNLSYGAAYAPWLNTNLPKTVSYRQIRGRLSKLGNNIPVTNLTSDAAILVQLTRLDRAIADVDRLAGDPPAGVLAQFLINEGGGAGDIAGGFQLRFDAFRTRLAGFRANDGSTVGNLRADYRDLFDYIYRLADAGIDNVADSNGAFTQADPADPGISYISATASGLIQDGLREQLRTLNRYSINANARVGGTANANNNHFIDAALSFDAAAWTADEGGNPVNIFAVDAGGVPVLPPLAGAELDAVYPLDAGALPVAEQGAAQAANMEHAAGLVARVFGRVDEHVRALGADARSLEAQYQSAAVNGFPLLRSILDRAANAVTQMPPSGAMAGVYAAVDAARGVHKAPANVSLNGVDSLVDTITAAEQGELNIDSTAGKSVNAIRAFVGRGTLVWGARTLDGNSDEWRYVNVRRFFNMVEESTKKASERFVFEPNDKNTWVKVQGMIQNFLLLQWRNGALQGSTPDQAFFVKVGLGQTMTALDVLQGRMIVEIGMAVVRPAEFIILRFSHKMPEA